MILESDRSVGRGKRGGGGRGGADRQMLVAGITNIGRDYSTPVGKRLASDWWSEYFPSLGVGSVGGWDSALDEGCRELRVGEGGVDFAARSDAGAPTTGEATAVTW